MRKRLLALLRVPERPEPPPGSGAKLETFRAERGFFHYTVLMWFPRQAAALAGLLFSLAFLGRLGNGKFDFVKAEGLDRLVEKLGEADIGFAWLRFDLADILLFFEALALVTWVSQLLFTGLLLEVSWTLRWYMVGEHSLRIRQGLWSVREQTMTIANIQNMIVRQGPLQRLFGISDLEVHTAGGGSRNESGTESKDSKNSFHVGRFRGVKDASALRDKIRTRLLALTSGDRMRQSGESSASGKTPVRAVSTERPADLESAAQALLAEAKALRQAALEASVRWSG